MTTPLMKRLGAHLQHNGPVILTHSGKMFGASSEWGQEAADSPMVGAAAYGMDADLEAALGHMLAEAGIDDDEAWVDAQVDAARRAASHVDDLDAPAPAGMFRAKPSAVDAVQWTGDATSEAACATFAPGKIAPVHVGDRAGTVELRLFAGANGAQGWVPVPVGHWIVSQPGDRSDVWPVDPDYFAGKYEAAR